MLKSIVLATTGAIALATGSVAVAQEAAKPAPAAMPKEDYGTWGVDLAGRDLSVKPGDDFQLYAGGKWLAANEIPAAYPMLGTGLMVYLRTQGDLQKLIAAAPAGSAYGTVIRDYLDEAAIEKIGDAPLKADVAKMMALADKAAFTRFMSQTGGRFGSSFASFGVLPDPANAAMNTVALGSGGLGMPNRDFYLVERFAPQRDAYKAYLERTFSMLGIADPAGSAAKVIALETSLAKSKLTPEQARDLDRLKTTMTLEEIGAYAPGIDWSVMLEGSRIPAQAKYIVADKEALRDTAATFAATPLETLKLWQAVRMASQAAGFLDKKWVDSAFTYSKAMSGVAQLQPRPMRAIQFTSGALGQLIGQDYVKANFTPTAKAKMNTLVANLKAAMGDRIRSSSWMGAATKEAALEKLAKMDVMVGYPDTWRDYTSLQLVPGDLYGNVQRIGAFNYAYSIADAGKAVDRKKWAMSPQTVDAYNGLLENKIVFPAGILQAPYFSETADDAVNYGAIGAIIGHEITHGFDDQGRRIDATGALRDWWTAEDAKRFEAQATILGEQYAKFEAVPGVFVNPKLTMGENIADVAGLQIALDAYHKSLGGKKAPVIDGLTGDQRFFLAFAQAWRAKQRPDALKAQVASDPHSPARFRANGPVRNIDAWYTAFNVKPGDAMYIAPADRARVW